MRSIYDIEGVERMYHKMRRIYISAYSLPGLVTSISSSCDV